MVMGNCVWSERGDCRMRHSVDGHVTTSAQAHLVERFGTANPCDSRFPSVLDLAILAGCDAGYAGQLFEAEKNGSAAGAAVGTASEWNAVANTALISIP